MHRIRIALALSLFAVVSCEAPFGLGDDRDDDLRDARGRWARNGYASYDLTLRQLCFCGFVEPVRIEVRNGEKAATLIAATGEPLPYPIEFPTVSGLFAIIEDALDRDAHELDVTYHPDLGYPVEIAIDYIENAVDDEVTWRVSSVVRR